MLNLIKNLQYFSPTQNNSLLFPKPVFSIKITAFFV